MRQSDFGELPFVTVQDLDDPARRVCVSRVTYALSDDGQRLTASAVSSDVTPSTLKSSSESAVARARQPRRSEAFRPRASRTAARRRVGEKGGALVPCSVFSEVHNFLRIDRATLVSPATSRVSLPAPSI